MDYKIIIDFYKEQVHIFGICPCCNEIFHLPETSLSIKTKKVILSESKDIMDLQTKNMRLTEKVELLNDKVDDYKYKISELKHDLKNNDTQEITKVKKEGRKEAINSSKSFIPIFEKKKYDPRDARLIFSPIEFLIFEGLTENKEISELILLSKRPNSKEQEQISKSISASIKKGNFDFQVIRYSNKGIVEYE